MASDIKLNAASSGLIFIAISSFLNNFIDISFFVLVVGIIVMINYYLSYVAIKVAKKNKWKTEEQKEEIENLFYPNSEILYAFAKLIGYAGLMFSCIYVQDIVGDAIPIVNSFKTIVFVSEISFLEKVLNKGLGVDINFVNKIISYLPKAKTREKIHSSKHRKFPS